MEGLGDGYEAFVERLQMDIAASSATKSSNQASSHSGHPPHPSRAHQSRYTGYPSPTNAFTPMTEASPALSDSSTRMTGCMSVEVSMEDAVSSPGPPCVTGPMRMPSPAHHFSSDVNQMPDAPPRPRSHRRAQSEIAFRLPDELLFEEELRGAESHPLLDDEAEELLSIYLDLEEKYTPGGLSNSAVGAVNGNTKSLPPHHSRSLSVDRVFNGFDGRQSGSASISSRGPSDVPKPRHHHSNSMDGSLSIKQEFLTSDLDSFDTKKNMTADKLAELALIDPKRAKRILANRQSAARSKERKMRYISELERKVQTLQMEATTLSAQLTVLQRDSTGLTTENKELKLRLQSMEQQAQLRNALNDALKEEVQRLKLATGHLSTANGNAFKIGAEHPSLNQSFYQLQKPSQHHTSQQLQQGQSSLSNNQQGVQTQAHSDFIQHKSFGPL